MSKNNENQLMTQIISLASITADADVYGAYFPQKSLIRSAWLVNGANISASDSNKATVSLMDGATLIAIHSTALTGGDSLSANVPSEMSLSGSTGLPEVAAGTWLKVAYDETGTYAMTNAFVIVNYFPL
jgi:hypothetical protein